ncbi:hypothetical protein EJ03DRAFT_51098 [Teratosphaeria nubilosa]|uniref:Uncharacterized protein n=1 Tax=Teratosphaeria nubilosa TaxID=161662 RepID=A0A6G1LEC9_9PEZI|nr:hypothetical protein EJ03DRAFT_51098 [Teratosphaeria nubilosa]
MSKDSAASMPVVRSTAGTPQPRQKPALPVPANCQVKTYGAAYPASQQQASAEGERSPIRGLLMMRMLTSHAAVNNGQNQTPAPSGLGAIVSFADPKGKASTTWTAIKSQPPWGLGAASPTNNQSSSSAGVTYQDPGVYSQMGGAFTAQQGPTSAPSTLSQADVGLPPGIDPPGVSRTRHHVRKALNNPALRGLDR